MVSTKKKLKSMKTITCEVNNVQGENIGVNCGNGLFMLYCSFSICTTGLRAEHCLIWSTSFVQGPSPAPKNKCVTVRRFFFQVAGFML